MPCGGAHWGYGVSPTQAVRRLRLSVPASAGRRVMSSRRVPARRRMLSWGEPQRQLPCGATASQMRPALPGRRGAHLPRRDHHSRRYWSPVSERINARSARDGRRVATSPPRVRSMRHKRCGPTALDGGVGSPSNGSVAAGPAGPQPTIQCLGPDSPDNSHLTGAELATYCDGSACTRPYLTVDALKTIFRVIET